MRITLLLDYFTRWGENLYVEFTGHDPLPMTNTGGSSWAIDIDDPEIASEAEYTYTLRDNDGKELRREWRGHRLPAVTAAVGHLHIADAWRDRPAARPFLTTPFTDCICRREHHGPEAAPLVPMSVGFTVEAPLVKADEAVAICGSIPELGSWNPDKAIVMSDAGFPEWRATVAVDPSVSSFEFKLLTVDRRSHELKAWEPRDNRVANLGHMTEDSATELARIDMALTPEPWRGAGVSIPVFSLRSREDWGVGDFLDLIPLVDWAVASGQRFIQLLPVNDTTMTGTWLDSYPYNANSTFALHPMYLRPDDAGLLPDDRMAMYASEKARLQALDQVDYEKVNELKNRYMRELYERVATDLVADPAFNSFVEKNTSWLTPYAAYCVLRDKYGTADSTLWGVYSQYNPQHIAALIDENFHEITFVYFTQFVLDRQLRRARDYAHAHGVALKGDIPIGISRTSVDAWKLPELFNLDASAGAPPDDFSVLGQNWGFPTYNWDAMSRDGFAWWKARFRKMAEYFDAYRIDHVLGFFRIWQIQNTSIHGLLGVFNSALPFTAEELRLNYNFQPDPAELCKPFIASWSLPDFFGDLSDRVINDYLLPLPDGRYQLRPEYSNQRRISEAFAALPADSRDADTDRICRGLMDLCDDVLFIEDPYRKGHYHPRIEGNKTHAFRNLCDYDKWLFQRIHDDFFYRRNDEYWRSQGLWKLPPVVEATDMLTCAEDLGMIPACVPDVLRQLQILTLEIQRMPKTPGMSFGDTWHYPYMSVCTTSTHDMPGIRQWWESDHARAQEFYNNVLHCEGVAPQYAEPWICNRIVREHLGSPSMLCILPLQDWLSIDGGLRRRDPREEQINEPAESRHYWRYRMHLTLEELLAAGAFNSEVREMIESSGRSL